MRHGGDENATSQDLRFGGLVLRLQRVDRLLLRFARFPVAVCQFVTRSSSAAICDLSRGCA